MRVHHFERNFTRMFEAIESGMNQLPQTFVEVAELIPASIEYISIRFLNNFKL